MGLLSDYFLQKDVASHLKQVFCASIMFENENVIAFPKTIFMQGSGLHAYLCRLMVEPAHAGRVFEILSMHFPLTGETIGRGVTLRRPDGKALNLEVHPDFHGVCFGLITNALDLLGALSMTRIPPPPPWVAFPEIVEPFTMGGMQGSMDYWWSWYGMPFWDSMTGEERFRYIEDASTPPAWKEWLLHLLAVEDRLG